MARALDQAKITDFTTHFPRTAEQSVATFERVYEEHRYRVFALAFWMTDSEVAAEEISTVVFRRAFANGALPAGETIDRMLLAELRELMPIGNLRLEIQSSSEPVTIRGNVKRIDLERAVVQLPATERLVFLMHDVESYDHARIAQILGITEQESQMGLHQARLRLRELLGSSL